MKVVRAFVISLNFSLIMIAMLGVVLGIGTLTAVCIVLVTMFDLFFIPFYFLITHGKED